MFTSNGSLKILADSKALSCDGTFKIAPKLWHQVMIICAQIAGGLWVPVLFAFLPDKKYETYLAFFGCMKTCLDDIGEKIAASYIMIDFETAIRQAWRANFCDCEVKGCHFHMAKCIWNKVVDLGFKGKYVRQTRIHTC